MENYSKQREEIIAIVKELYNHPTAEEIYVLTKQKDPSVSRSTVYRNLNGLVKKGMIQQIAVSNGPDRYDYKENRQKHGHIICKQCGKMYDFHYNFDLEEIKTSVYEETRVEILDDEMVIKGICQVCKENKN